MEGILLALFTAMSSAENLKRFISDRLAAAAEEIFGVFEKTIAEYEEELDRQRKLFDVVWRPVVKLRRVGECDAFCLDS